MWPIILGLWLIAIVLLYNARNGSKGPVVSKSTLCHTCNGPTVVHRIQHGGGRSGYDLVECAECDQTATYVHGLFSRLVYCPDCSQRTLEVRDVSPPGGRDDEPRRLEEHCHVCGYSRIGHLLRIAGARRKRKRGLVIRFPTERNDSKD